MLPTTASLTPPLDPHDVYKSLHVLQTLFNMEMHTACVHLYKCTIIIIF